MSGPLNLEKPGRVDFGKSLYEIRKFENFHILLWLLKDTSWLMGWRAFGIFMILPTVGFAVFIAWKSRKDPMNFLPNLAVICWILANSFWMMTEFFGVEEELRIFAAIPFSCGLALICCYYFSLLKRPKSN